MIYNVNELNKEEVFNLYIEKELSINDCSLILNCTGNCFKQALDLYNIPKRKKYGKTKGRVNKLINNPNLGSKTKEYFNQIKQMNILPKNEIIRRNNISNGLKNREVTWGNKISETLTGNPNLGIKTQAYYDNIKQTGILPENEIIRRQKIGVFMKGRKVTWGRKIGDSMFGNTNAKGRIVSQKTRNQISKSTSKSIQRKIREEGFHWGMKGKHHSEETKLKDAITHLGDKSSLWQGGISYEPYTEDFNHIKKKEIRKRDNNTCQICLKFGKDVHHIDYNKKNCNSNNLITLCRKCHIKTNLNREYWQKLLKENLLKNK
jgi:hypothetical protein